jgi:hypothetical protein
MVDPGLWALMQRVEKLRHRGDCVERAGEELSAEGRDLADDIARQWREAAEQAYAIAVGREIEPVSPLRRP